MKKTILLLVLSLFIFSCSSDSDDNDAIKQDFTDINYLKSTIVGTWKLTHVNYSGSWNSITNPSSTVQNEAYYKFVSDNTYIHKPLSAPNDNSMNESGTYSLTAATSSTNANVKLTYTSFGSSFTDTIILQSYNNGIVEIAYTSITCPSGTCYERYQKQ